MTIGLPKTVTKLYSKLKIPRSLEKKLFKSYSYYLNRYVKIWTWYNYDRHNAASLHPLKILWIDPQEIEYGTYRKQIEEIDGTLLPKVLNGDWDEENTYRIKKRLRYKAMKQHFRDEVPWEETQHYKLKKRDLEEKGKTSYGGEVSSEEQLKERYAQIDDLYHKIAENGYKTQREIKDKGEIVNAKLRPDHYANELNEISVDIGKEGEIIFEENRHRFYIAKILELKKIPVRILVRHKEWQEKRNKAVEQPETLDEKFRDHPDIEYLNS